MQPFSVNISDFKQGYIVKKMSGKMAPGDYFGTVLAVYPKLGCLDVEWPLGVQREFPEDLLIINSDKAWTKPHTSSARKLANIANKVSLYWNERGRKYRKTKSETNISEMKCPKCGNLGLKKTRYKHMSDLYGCPECMFLIKRDDIIGE